MAQLIAIKSTYQDLLDGRHDQIRGGWAREFVSFPNAHVRFFIGADSTDSRTHRNLRSDEVQVQEADEQGLVYKVRGICKYARSKNVDQVAIVGLDETYEPPPQLVKFNDYSGVLNYEGAQPQEVQDSNGVSFYVDRCWGWSQGPYILSRRAAIEIADTSPRGALYIDRKYDAFWAAQVLGPLTLEEGYTFFNL
jgi:hypothetical protein